MGSRLSRRAFTVLITTMAGCSYFSPTQDQAPAVDGALMRQVGATTPPSNSGSSTANTHYVAEDGVNSDRGTKTSPFATISRALDAALPGDRILVRGGTYVLDQVQIDEITGKRGQPIRLLSYPGERPVIAGGGVEIVNSKYLAVKGFEIKGSDGIGLRVFNSAHITLANLDVHHNGRPGVLVNGVATNELVNIVSHHNEDDGDESNADGFHIARKEDGASGAWVLKDCISHHNKDDGFDLYNARDGIVRGCIAYSNGLDGSERILSGEGNGFKLTSGPSHHNGGHLIHHCASYNNKARGFYTNTANDTIELDNCTAVSNDVSEQNYPNFHFLSAPPESVVRNCLSWKGTVSGVQAIDSSHNSWDLNIGDPEFRSLTPTSHTFLRLSTGSPAIDVGIDVGLRYIGTAPDLGAFEYGGSNDW